MGLIRQVVTIGIAWQEVPAFPPGREGATQGFWKGVGERI